MDVRRAGILFEYRWLYAYIYNVSICNIWYTLVEMNP